MAYDLVIRGGTVIDGSGGDSRRADVAVLGDRIVAVGKVSEAGKREIDADGHVVTPGFIDGHTHMDAQVFWDPYGTCSSWHGVTSVVMGNCGFTLAPGREAERELVVRNIERSEDISGEAMAAGIDWKWESFPEYLAVVDQLPKAINYAANIGHSALRVWAMGERAFSEPACEGDLSVMRDEVRRALRAGAIGFTTSCSTAHRTPSGDPVASRFAKWDEVVALVKVMQEEGSGLFQLAHHKFHSADREERAEWCTELAQLAIDTGVPITFGTLPSGGRFRELLAAIDSAAEKGARMFGMSHSRGVSGTESFRTTLAFDRLEAWKAVRSLPFEKQRQLFMDPEVRARLVQAARNGDYGHSTAAEPRTPNYDLLKVFDTPLPPWRSVREVAAERGVDPAETMIDLALASDFNQLFFEPHSLILDEDILEVMRHPRTVMTFSDSGAHVGQIMDSSIQTHLLGYWVREREEFSLSEAVNMVSGRVADAWGFVDRGYVREGFVADLNVIDPVTVSPAMPTVEHDFPAGARRLKQKALGFKATIVAGEVTLSEGEHTGALPGQLLRGPWREQGGVRSREVPILISSAGNQAGRDD